MAKCKYCGKDAGFFSSVHKECESFAQETIAYFKQLASHAFLHGGNENELKANLEKAARAAIITPEQRQKAALEALENGVSQALEDGVVTEGEEKNLLMLTRVLGISNSVLHSSQAWDQLVKSRVLADILNGRVPKRFTMNGLSVLLQKGEDVIWGFGGVDFNEARKRTHYVGGSVGVSVRVAKGVYLRTAAFRGHPVQKTEMVHVDTGELVITNKHIFFQGGAGVVKMAVKKLAAVEPYADAIGFQLDTATAKRRVFVGVDGWFAYNLVSNLNLL